MIDQHLARAALLAALLAATLWSRSALALRPFDGTDASVADLGTLNTELGPVGYLRQGGERMLTAPTVTLSYGFAPHWEASLTGQDVHGLSPGSRGSALTGNAAFLKTVLHEGSLQEKPGPSIASEFGLLLPGINGESGTGGHIAGILSQQWPALTVHLNLAVNVTREQHGDLFLDAIVEGPRDWSVRPVAEIFHEREFGGARIDSALIGAIWQVRDNLSFDIGLRGARSDGHSQGELRAGVTFALPLR